MKWHLRVAGSDLRLETNQPLLDDYLRLHFPHQLAADTGQAASLHSLIHWRRPERFRFRISDGGLRRDGERWWKLGRDMESDGARLRWRPGRTLPGLGLEVRPGDGSMELEAWFDWQGSWWKEQRLLRRIHPLHRALRQLAYFTLYYPAFWWAERQGYRLEHAAGIALAGRGIAIAGPAGCGKSSLALALAALPEGRLLSDNLILVHGRQMRSVYEPIRLGREPGADELGGFQRSTLRYSRRLFVVHANKDKLLDSSPVRWLFFPVLGREGERILTPEEARARLRLAGRHASEIQPYRLFQAALGTLSGSPTAMPGTRSEHGLAELPALELGLGLRRDPARWQERVLRLISA